MSGSLGLRIFGGFGLVILLTLGVTGIVFFSLLGGYRSQIDRNTLRTLADQVLFGVTQFAARNPSLPALSRYLEVQAQETGVLLFILDADGRVIRDLSPGTGFEQIQLPVTLDDVRANPDSYLAGEFDPGAREIPFLATLIPVDRLGRGTFVAIALPDPGASRVAADLIPRLLFSGLMGLGVALVVGLFLSRSIYNPIRRVTAAVRAVGGGRYETRAPEEGPAETQELARAFNRMTVQVQTNQQTLQDFMAEVSHELRTPLTSIRGFTQALLDGTVEDDARRVRSAEVIDDEARRMLRLVEGLLDLSRIQAGELSMRREPVDLSEVAEHVADVFAQRAEEAGLHLRTEAAPMVSPVSGDFDRLVQVVTNLVANAIQHTRTGGVTLQVGASAALVHLTVEDSGDGISPADLDHVFDRFYRRDGAGRPRGTGLGLAISREIVRAHGGDISVRSELNVGTRFRISLPAEARA